MLEKEITMRRGLLSLLILVAPAVMLSATTGCEQKITSVQQSEQIQETEPQMTSPGQEVLE